MSLVKFLVIGAVLSVTLGELGKFPFGASSVAVSVLDLIVSFSLVCFLVWKLSTKERIHFPSVFKWLGLFWLVGVVSLLVSLTVLDAVSVATGSLYLFRFILFSSLLVVGYNLHKQKLINSNHLTTLFILVSVMLAVLGLIQLLIYPNFEDPPFFLTDFGFDPHRGRLTSTFLDPNFLGAYLSLNLGLVIYKLYRGGSQRWWVVISLLLAAILLTLSRSAYLLVVISSILIVIFARKQIHQVKSWLIPACLLILLAAVMVLNPVFSDRISGAVRLDKSSRERIESWGKGLAIAQVNLITGVGFNNIRAISDNLNLVKTYSPEGGHSGAGIDSSLLLVLASTGIVGLIIYLTFWVRCLTQLWSQKDLHSLVVASLIVGLLVNSQFINSLFFPSLMVWYFLMLGVTVEK